MTTVITPRTNRCTATKSNGERCSNVRWGSSNKCYFHDNPQNAVKCGEKGGKRRAVFLSDLADLPAPKTAADVRDLLATTISETRAGKIDTKTASCIAYLSAALISAIETVELEGELRKLLVDGPNVQTYVPPLPEGAVKVENNIVNLEKVGSKKIQ